ncbi:MAG: tryptophan--tRNA ligase [Alphaproteobacteria bacterium]|nr:tryptophan--tRNA ligase [Alphaproteobacteria bacterium]
MSNKNIVLTGDRPTGCLHLGHYVGSLKSRVELQNSNNDCYIMIADIQALSDNFDNPEKVKLNVVEVCKDYISVGIDPEKCTIFIQSLIPALTEITMYYMNLVSVSRLERNPTVKAELQQKKFADSVTAGFLCYPVSQAADITAFKATTVPVGEDQLPLIELTNEIVRRFNRIYHTDILKETDARLSNVQRLVGIDGKAKASKSLNNAIFMNDDKETLKNKVYSMYTDPKHLKVSDPGQVEGNVVFTYLDAFHNNKEEVEDLKNKYRKGGLGDTTIKSLLNQTLQDMLAPIREKRAEISHEYIMDILQTGSKKANIIANETLQQVRDAIGIVYY